MLLLLLLLVPVGLGLLGLYKWGDRVTIREFLTLEGVSLAFILICIGIAHWQATDDIELWSGRVTNKFRDTVSCSHSYSCNCRTECTGSGNSRSCSTVCDTCYEHSHDYDWTVQFSTNDSLDIDRVDRQGVNEPPRFTAVKIGEPAAIEHHYTNYIKANPDSVLRRRGVKVSVPIPPYPQVYDYYRVNRYIPIGFNDQYQEWWNKLLAEANGDLGPSKQVSITVIAVKSADSNYEYALQEQWNGGKKNELTIMIGVPEYPKIAWARVVSWSTSEDMKVELRDAIMQIGSLDPTAIMAKVVPTVRDKFQRRHMRDFKYLSAGIQPGPVGMTIIFILTIIISGGLLYYFYQENPFEADRVASWRSRTGYPTNRPRPIGRRVF